MGQCDFGFQEGIHIFAERDNIFPIWAGVLFEAPHATEEGVVGVENLQGGEHLAFTNPARFISDVLINLRLEGIIYISEHCSYLSLTGFRAEIMD